MFCVFSWNICAHCGALNLKEMLQVLKHQDIVNPWLISSKSIRFNVKLLKKMSKLDQAINLNHMPPKSLAIGRDLVFIVDIDVKAEIGNDPPVNFSLGPNFFDDIITRDHVLIITSGLDNPLIEAAKKYSKLNQQIWILDLANNWTVSEVYNVNNLRIWNDLGKYVIHKSNNLDFVWEKNVSRNYINRRGNFQGKVFIGMTEVSKPFMNMKPGYTKIYHPENDTYEVTDYAFGYYKAILEIMEV